MDNGYAAAQRDYDRQLPPEPKEMPYKCEYCGGEICEGETIYVTPDGKKFCEYCIEKKDAERED